METRTVARDNAVFFVVTVGMALGLEYFARAVFDSHLEESQFGTDLIGKPGYIRIDSSPIRKRGNDLWFEFANKVREGFLEKVSYEFSSATKFDGNLSDEMTIEKAGYVFSFHIRQYERDAEHGFEIINPEDFDFEDIPEDEILGRVVYLTITQKS